MKTNSNPPTDTSAVIHALDDRIAALTYKLDDLGRITEMAAFACEARRTLDAVVEQMQYFPDFEKHLRDSGFAHREWMEYNDATGDVLCSVSRQIKQCSAELDEVSLCAHSPHEACDRAVKP